MFYVKNVTHNFMYPDGYETKQEAINFVQEACEMDLIAGNITDIYRIVAV